MLKKGRGGYRHINDQTLRLADRGDKPVEIASPDRPDTNAGATLTLTRSALAVFAFSVPGKLYSGVGSLWTSSPSYVH